MRVEHIPGGRQGDDLFIFTRTHLGLLEAVPPTGKKVQVKDVDLWRIEDGQIVESWAHCDELGLLQQLGVLALGGEGEAFETSPQPSARPLSIAAIEAQPPN